MTDCIEAPAREWLERYVEGTLPEGESQSFEEHYFDCPACLSELQAIQAAQIQLKEHPVTARPRTRILHWPFMLSAGALAAALIVGLLTFNIMRRSSAPGPSSAAVQPPQPARSSQQIAQLADLRLPPYRETILRGTAEDSVFARGMRQYASGACALSIRTLAHVKARSAYSRAAQFYSGVCAMKIGDYPAAENLLHSVASGADSPQQEWAWYYLAQIALVRSDVTGARQNLDQVIALHGDLESQAQKQLAELPPPARK